MEDEGIITLTDNSGEEESFGFLDIIEYEGEEFIVLYPMNDDEGQLLILKVEEDATSDEYDSYVGIEDDDLVQAVFQAYLEKHKDEQIEN
ncbi:MAG: DUF1292 domain-containing protein [Ruminococcaceae bacterium]|nr:DUF1292 domain-containing protein [Oscillospiraceae bacterium]MBQ6873071.1 DUF1292 domain-containing protein [Clostridia bacterium]